MANSNKLAPIVLFVYNRLDHIRKTVEALGSNLLANESALFIYSDYPKDAVATDRVGEVRAFIKTIQGFKSVTIVERDKNWGLAASIIDGVTDIVNQYGKVIVLEDDIVTSPYFLTFMNDALDFYANKPEVWHISGWTFPHIKGVRDAFFWRTMNCWGWATWKNRWCYFEKDPEKLIATFSKRDIYRFNIYGADDMWGQVLANQTGKINSWAIFWYAVIFQHDGWCLNPAVSFVRNIGLDGTGVHCGINDSYSSDVLCNKKICFNEIKIRENRKAVRAIMRFYNREHGKRNIVNRIIGKAKYIVKKLIKIIPRRGGGAYKASVKCVHTWYGNEYGGFYVCSAMLLSDNRDILVYSCGVGEDISFDRAIMNDFTCKIFAFDPTPKSIEWIKSQNIPDNFIFSPFGISDKTEIQLLHLSNTPLDISASIYVHGYTSANNCVTVQMKRLEDIAKENHHTYVDILKMDIEGSEFAVIQNLPENVVFGQILVEFHERFLENGKKVLKESVKTLKKNGYYCFAVSEHGDEYSFVNKKEYIRCVMQLRKKESIG